MRTFIRQVRTLEEKSPQDFGGYSRVLYIITRTVITFVRLFFMDVKYNYHEYVSTGITNNTQMKYGSNLIMKGIIVNNNHLRFNWN